MLISCPTLFQQYRQRQSRRVVPLHSLSQKRLRLRVLIMVADTTSFRIAYTLHLCAQYLLREPISVLQLLPGEWAQSISLEDRLG